MPITRAASNAIPAHRRHTVTGLAARRVRPSCAADGIHHKTTGASSAPRTPPSVLSRTSSTSATRNAHGYAPKKAVYWAISMTAETPSDHAALAATPRWR